MVVGPGIQTRGGITTVIKAHSETECWKKWNCHWVASYIDKSVALKILFFITGLGKFLRLLPSAYIVHIHFSREVSAIRKFTFFLIAKIFQKKIVIQLHSGSERIINTKVNFIYKYLFKYADISIFLAENIKEEVEKHFKIFKATKIYNPCPVVNQKCLNIQNGKKRFKILFAGRITKGKGYEDLLEAFAKIAFKYPNWDLVFAGSGELERAKNLARQFDISKRTEFLGWIAGHEKATAFKTADIFCLPSYSEGFPMAVLDAWGYGLPVVTTPVGGLSEILKDGENALVFTPGDIFQLSQNFDKLISNFELRKKIGAASMHLCATIFSTGRTSIELDKMYRSL